MPSNSIQASLWSLQVTKTARIGSLSQNLNSQHVTRLNEIGFNIGREVTCIRAIPFGGPKIYQMNDSVFSLEEEIAGQIMLVD